MTEFRLTQISDTHLARRFSRLTANFERLSDHIDATRPDLVLNTGDMAFDAPNNPDDLEFARSLHDALPVPCRYLPGNHDIGDNPTQVGPQPSHPVNETGRQAYIAAFGDDRWRFEAAGWCFIGLNSLVMNSGAHQRGRTIRVAGFGAGKCAWQAGRAVPAQAALSQYARGSRARGQRDPLRAAPAAAAAARDAQRASTCAWSPAAMCINAATTALAACGTSGRPRPASSSPTSGRSGLRSRKSDWSNIDSQPDSFEVRHVRAPGMVDVDLDELLQAPSRAEEKAAS